MQKLFHLCNLNRVAAAKLKYEEWGQALNGLVPRAGIVIRVSSRHNTHLTLSNQIIVVELTYHNGWPLKMGWFHKDSHWRNIYGVSIHNRDILIYFMAVMNRKLLFK